MEITARLSHTDTLIDTVCFAYKILSQQTSRAAHVRFSFAHYLCIVMFYRFPNCSSPAIVTEFKCYMEKKHAVLLNRNTRARFLN